MRFPKQAIVKLIEGFKYEVKGIWGKLSEVPRIMVRESKSIETDRGHTGILRNYEVDFIVRTNSKMYLVETKAGRDLDSQNVAVKVGAAMAWCEQAWTVSPPSDYKQPQGWEYLLLSEGLFKSNQGLGFEALVPLCQGLRDRIIAQAQGTLFVP